jgi:hypothetical protein
MKRFAKRFFYALFLSRIVQGFVTPCVQRSRQALSTTALWEAKTITVEIGNVRSFKSSLSNAESFKSLCIENRVEGLVDEQNKQRIGIDEFDKLVDGAKYNPVFAEGSLLAEIYEMSKLITPFSFFESPSTDPRHI